MPIDQYLEIERKPSTIGSGREYQRSYSHAEQLFRVTHSERRRRIARRFVHGEQWGDWFANEMEPNLAQKVIIRWTTYPSHADETKTNELVRAIEGRLKIGKKNAEAMKNKLFDEIDRISETKKLGLVSEEEKGEFVRAIIKTADDLLKKTLEIRRSEG